MTDQIAGRETARCKNGEIIGFGRVIAVVFFYPFNCRVLYGRLLLTFTFIIISIPSTPHSFISGLKPFFSANPFHRSLPFLQQDWLHGFP